MINIHRFGNQVWLEGAWIASAGVTVREDIRNGERTYEVGFGSFGSDPVETQRARGQAILAACDYAELCKTLYKDKTKDQIEVIWEEELRTFYKTLYKEWNEKRNKREKL